MVLLFGISLAFALADAPSASAQSAEDECNEDDPAQFCPTQTPKPTSTPGPPTATRTPTPKPTSTPTCDDFWEPYNKKDEDANAEGYCPTPTPKPTRTNTPVPPTVPPAPPTKPPTAPSTPTPTPTPTITTTYTPLPIRAYSRIGGSIQIYKQVHRILDG